MSPNLPGPSEEQKLWKDIYVTVLTRVWMEERVEDWLLSFWTRVNTFASLLVALTSTSSAVAGLALWNSPSAKAIWASIASVAALASVLTSALDVSNRVKSHGEYRSGFLRMRLNAEALSHDLPSLTIEQGRKQFSELREKANDLIAKAPPDFALSKRRRAAIQDELDDILVNEGYSE